MIDRETVQDSALSVDELIRELEEQFAKPLLRHSVALENSEFPKPPALSFRFPHLAQDNFMGETGRVY